MSNKGDSELIDGPLRARLAIAAEWASELRDLEDQGYCPDWGSFGVFCYDCLVVWMGIKRLSDDLRDTIPNEMVDWLNGLVEQHSEGLIGAAAPVLDKQGSWMDEANELERHWSDGTSADDFGFQKTAYDLFASLDDWDLVLAAFEVLGHPADELTIKDNIKCSEWFASHLEMFLPLRRFVDCVVSTFRPDIEVCEPDLALTVLKHSQILKGAEEMTADLGRAPTESWPTEFVRGMLEGAGALARTPLRSTAAPEPVKPGTIHRHAASPAAAAAAPTRGPGWYAQKARQYLDSLKKYVLAEVEAVLEIPGAFALDAGGGGGRIIHSETLGSKRFFGADDVEIRFEKEENGFAVRLKSDLSASCVIVFYCGDKIMREMVVTKSVPTDIFSEAEFQRISKIVVIPFGRPKE